MDYEQTVSRLCGLPGPSGFEFEAAADAAEMLRPFVDEVMVDHMYSVIGVRRCGKKGAPKLLLDAHLDEVGYLVTGHKDGYLTFTSLGGVDPGHRLYAGSVSERSARGDSSGGKGGIWDTETG